jgi:hypothetical protein
MPDDTPHDLFTLLDPSAEQRDQMRGFAARKGQYCRYCDSMTVDPCLTEFTAQHCGGDYTLHEAQPFGEPMGEIGVKEAHRLCAAHHARRVRGQHRTHSLLESISNTLAGFAVSYLAWIPVSVYLLHRPWHPGEGLVVVLIFTVLSIARNYVLRRAFNRWT